MSTTPKENGTTGQSEKRTELNGSSANEWFTSKNIVENGNSDTLKDNVAEPFVDVEPPDGGFWVR